MIWIQRDNAQKRGEYVSFCWWNLNGLTPPGGISSEPHYWQYLRRIRYRLCDMGRGVPPSIIGVCEVSLDGLLDLHGELGGESVWHKIISGQATRSMGLILAKQDWILRAQDEIKVPRGSQRTRALLHVRVEHKTVRDSPLHVILTHWVKRGEAMSEEIRRREGAALADQLQKIVDVDPDAPVLIMGDFNADPIDPALIYWADSISQRCQLWETRPYGVTSGMFTGSPFKLDEASLRIYAGPTMLKDGKPIPFQPDAGIGYSDHLPICGRLGVYAEREGRVP